MKRRGTTNPADQWVLMTLGELVALLTGNRHHYHDQELEQLELGAHDHHDDEEPAA